LQRLAHVGQHLDRMRGHVATEIDEALEDRCRDLAVRHVDRRLDHGEDEAFAAEPVEIKVAFLGLQQAPRQDFGIHIVRQHFGKARFGQAKDPLRMPERVVRVESDGGQSAHGPEL
jgi:hypothetical protein